MRKYKAQFRQYHQAKLLAIPVNDLYMCLRGNEDIIHPRQNVYS